MEAERDKLVDLFLEVETLKRMPRTGWAMHGVSRIESVAEHSFGAAFVALALADVLNGETQAKGRRVPLDMEKVMVMALLHDLAEVRLTDLPASAAQLIPREVKSEAETVAMADLLSVLPGHERWGGIWREFEDESSPEGRLVRDADKLEMMVQCLRYEQAGSLGLDEFWEAMDRRAWHYAIAADLYDRLREMRLRRTPN